MYQNVQTCVLEVNRPITRIGINVPTLVVLPCYNAMIFYPKLKST